MEGKTRRKSETLEKLRSRNVSDNLRLKSTNDNDQNSNDLDLISLIRTEIDESMRIFKIEEMLRRLSTQVNKYQDDM